MSAAPDPRSPAEHLVGRDIPDQAGARISDRRLQSERTLENYIRASIRPRWMERLMEIEQGMRRAKRELREAYEELRAECGSDRDRFARLWEQVARRWDFEHHNDLVRTHNQWYPIERDLPQDPRTGEFLLIAGRSYVRPELDGEWILAEFPA